jgi:hypothetical protein
MYLLVGCLLNLLFHRHKQGSYIFLFYSHFLSSVDSNKSHKKIRKAVCIFVTRVSVNWDFNFKFPVRAKCCYIKLGSIFLKLLPFIQYLQFGDHSRYLFYDSLPFKSLKIVKSETFPSDLLFCWPASRYNRVKKNQLDAQLILSIFRLTLHVLGVSRPIIRRYNRMCRTIGTYSL